MLRLPQTRFRSSENAMQVPEVPTQYKTIAREVKHLQMASVQINHGAQ
jgi:hypothetical protein